MNKENNERMEIGYWDQFLHETMLSVMNGDRFSASDEAAAFRHYREAREADSWCDFIRAARLFSCTVIEAQERIIADLKEPKKSTKPANIKRQRVAADSRNKALRLVDSYRLTSNGKPSGISRKQVAENIARECGLNVQDVRALLSEQFPGKKWKAEIVARDIF